MRLTCLGCSTVYETVSKTRGSRLPKDDRVCVRCPICHGSIVYSHFKEPENDEERKRLALHHINDWLYPRIANCTNDVKLACDVCKIKQENRVDERYCKLAQLACDIEYDRVESRSAWPTKDRSA